ncbi:hypothetical protein OOT55_14335 [Marinimicrobium sp. C6131]|uniref:hypothetical protein n=1 Tax=Marinimicrobium sp. C6131 TaxID=3022676 RepID=UPI00223D0245|nr:hypothetical protein [Marinimicrobium sp. C6131]UZJ43826.1 hypothetical protein OOT55_14335 [Marinimicrobium sp. C6131]
MAENIIFYSICLFFSLIALGAVWSHRYSYTKVYLALFLGIPAALIGVMAAGLDVVSILDVREFFPYTFDADNQLEARGKGVVAVLMIAAVVAFFTSTMCLLIQARKRITSAGKGRS